MKGAEQAVLGRTGPFFEVYYQLSPSPLPGMPCSASGGWLLLGGDFAHNYKSRFFCTDGEFNSLKERVGNIVMEIKRSCKFLHMSSVYINKPLSYPWSITVD